MAEEKFLMKRPSIRPTRRRLAQAAVVARVLAGTGQGADADRQARLDTHCQPWQRQPQTRPG
jgi:hypothetical protein